MTGAGALRADDAWDGEALLGTAERVVAQALARGAREAEAFLEKGASLEVDVEGGRIASTGASRGQGGAVRLVAAGGKVGFAYFTHPDDALRAIDAALRNCRLADATGYSLPVPDARPPSLAGRWDGQVAQLHADEATGLARQLLAGAQTTCPRGLVAGGGASLEAGVAAVASSAGARAWDRETKVSAHASVVLEDGERSVSASESLAQHGAGLDAHWVGAEAGRTTAMLAGPTPLPAGGRMDVVLRPSAAAELVLDLAVASAMGDDACRGKSVWSGRLGQPVAHPGLRIADEPLAAGAIGATPFDDEGLPARPLPIVEGGVLRAYVFDSWDAHRHKAATTRSAVRAGFKSRPAAGTHHLVLSSRETVPLARLVAGVEDGLLVDSVLGAHTANVVTGDFSVTSPNAWRIRGGEVAGPVSEVALAGNLPDLLGSLDGTSSETRRLGGATLPFVRLRGVSVSI